jgi:hypothetical protein
MVHRLLIIVTTVALAACPAKSPVVETVPGPILAPPAGVTIEEGELILRSAGTDIGHEQFVIDRVGDQLDIALTSTTTYPVMAIELAMRVDEASWQIERFDLGIRGGKSDCVMRRRQLGDVVEIELELPDGHRRLLDREGREHAAYYVSLRPTLTQTAICAAADDQPRALESFPPWYVVHTAPREPTEHATADGARRLDRVRVDELIDVYCDGAQLAIVHYAAHAFTAARTEYDPLAQRLSAMDPVDDPWAGSLACPPPQP